MAAESPSWTLISVLFSTVPLDGALAGLLHETAVDLFREDRSVQQIAGDALSGHIVNLKKTLQLGAISGPAFEATLETARGKGKVRFLLTTQGLELAGAQPARRRRSTRGRSLPN